MNSKGVTGPAWGHPGSGEGCILPANFCHTDNPIGVPYPDVLYFQLIHSMFIDTMCQIPGIPQRMKQVPVHVEFTVTWGRQSKTQRAGRSEGSKRNGEEGRGMSCAGAGGAEGRAAQRTARAKAQRQEAL